MVEKYRIYIKVTVLVNKTKKKKKLDTLSIYDIRAQEDKTTLNIFIQRLNGYSAQHNYFSFPFFFH